MMRLRWLHSLQCHSIGFFARLRARRVHPSGFSCSAIWASRASHHEASNLLVAQKKNALFPVSSQLIQYYPSGAQIDGSYPSAWPHLCNASFDMPLHTIARHSAYPTAN